MKSLICDTYTHTHILKNLRLIVRSLFFQASDGAIPRSKPFKYTYEKEIVMYAYFKKLDYFSTECIYSPNAYRGHARAFLKDLEKIRSTAIIDIIHSGNQILYNYEILSSAVNTLSLQHNAASFPLFYRYHNCYCSTNLRNCIPAPFFIWP